MNRSQLRKQRPSWLSPFSPVQNENPKPTGNNNENPYHHRPESAGTPLRRVWSERVPAVHQDAAAGRPGRRFHEGTLREPLLLCRGGPANNRRSDSVARTICAAGLDAARPGDREYSIVSHLPPTFRIATGCGGWRFRVVSALGIPPGVQRSDQAVIVKSGRR